MSIDVESLPAYEQITSEPIRGAAAGFSAARSAHDQARKDLVELEQTREAAEWRDAEAAEKARAEGKAEPKRTHVAAHDRETDTARHELKVAELAAQRAEQDLHTALERDGEAWAREVTESVDKLRASWKEGVSALISLHSQLSAELSVARVVVGKQPGFATLAFPAREIHDLEIQSGQRNARGVLDTSNVLAGLAALGMPEPEPSGPVVHPPLKPTYQADGHEQAEQRAFIAHANSPEEIERRRQRTAKRRRESDEALAASLEG